QNIPVLVVLAEHPDGQERVDEMVGRLPGNSEALGYVASLHSGAAFGNEDQDPRYTNGRLNSWFRRATSIVRLLVDVRHVAALYRLQYFFVPNFHAWVKCNAAGA